MNWFKRILDRNKENKELVRSVRTKAKETTELVTDIQKTREQLENNPLPNFPISGFLVSGTPRKVRVRGANNV
jgi:hypothetical protein